MKVASFNVNSLRARLAIVLGWLAENQPDILAVQETKVQDHDFPADAFDKTGYRYVFKGEKSYNGVAIFSKSAISNVEFGFPDEPTRLGEGTALATETIGTPSRSRKDQARLIKAEINPVRKLEREPAGRTSARASTELSRMSSVEPSFLSNGVNGIVVVNTYIPQGYLPESVKFTYKLNWFSRLRKYFEDNFSPADPILWVGDFNIAPLPIDVYDPQGLLGHVCYHPDVHKALNEVMEWGFADVFRVHCREAGQYTYWDYRPMNAFKRNLGWRLDHIMATQPLAKKSTTSYIDKKPRLAERPSDHTPIIAEFDW